MGLSLSKLVASPIITTIIGSLLNYLLANTFCFIQNSIKQLTSVWHTIAFNKISFNPNLNPRCKLAIFEQIKSLNLHIKGNNLILTDGYKKPDYIVKNKSYLISKKNNKKIYVDVSDNKIAIRAFKFLCGRVTMKNLKSYFDDLYKIYNAASNVMLFFTSDSDQWTRPISRIPRNFKKLKLTNEMKLALDDVDDFTKNEKRYYKKGYSYRRGYFFHGKTGTGKSTMAEIIAYKYNRVIYMLTLNSKNMTDTSLINLLCSVPPNSIIIIDEIDKQIEALSKNKKACVTIAGLLTALDGPQRLSDSTIIILTANKLSFLSKIDQKSLLRRGRIDKVIEFKTKI